MAGQKRNDYPTPYKLGSEALSMWHSVTKDYTLRRDELRILKDICREIDIVERMEKAMRDDNLIKLGSMKQDVANPLLAELARHRALIGSLFKQLRLPDITDSSVQQDQDATAKAQAARSSKYRAKTGS